MSRRRIALISTGGTIEKTYDELAGVLSNRLSVLDVLLASLELNGVEIVRVPLMNKDSGEMTDADHTLIARTAGTMSEAHDGVVVVHGTDTLTCTGERMHDLLGVPPVPIVLTGAMRPYALRNTDAIQNTVEALLAVQFMDPGVYVAMHNTVLRFPGVEKDRQRGTFVAGAADPPDRPSVTSR
jgi:L-asparaginase